MKQLERLRMLTDEIDEIADEILGVTSDEGTYKLVGALRNWTETATRILEEEKS